MYVCVVVLNRFTVKAKKLCKYWHSKPWVGAIVIPESTSIIQLDSSASWDFGYNLSNVKSIAAKVYSVIQQKWNLYEIDGDNPPTDAFASGPSVLLDLQLRLKGGCLAGNMFSQELDDTSSRDTAFLKQKLLFNLISTQSNFQLGNPYTSASEISAIR